MINILYKKISSVFFKILFFIFTFLPIKILGDGPMEYVLLEPDVFGEEIKQASSMANFLNEAFKFGLAIATALSVVEIVWGGVEIMLSESPFARTNGKERITNAIYGLLLALFSWLILYTINPQILEINF